MTLHSLLSRCVALAAGVALVLAISAGAAAQQAKGAATQEAKGGAKGTCQRCHAAGLPLPEKHPKITGREHCRVRGVSCLAGRTGEAAPGRLPAASPAHQDRARLHHVPRVFAGQAVRGDGPRGQSGRARRRAVREGAQGDGYLGELAVARVHSRDQAQPVVRRMPPEAADPGRQRDGTQQAMRDLPRRLRQACVGDQGEAQEPEHQPARLAPRARDRLHGVPPGTPGVEAVLPQLPYQLRHADSGSGGQGPPPAAKAATPAPGK